MESFLFVFVYVTAGLTLVGSLWVAVIAYTNDDLLMCVVSVLCCVGGVFYGLVYFRQCQVPTLIMMVSMVSGWIASRFIPFVEFNVRQFCEVLGLQ